MTLEEKCAQVLMLAVGTEKWVTPEFREVYRAVPAGAVLILGYNIAETPEGVLALTGGLQDLARGEGRGMPLFIAVDHEGGSVFRFGRVATRLPDASAVGAAAGGDAGSPGIAREFVREQVYGLYLNAARQLSALGFSMNLAPVLEPLNDENQEFLRRRAYSADPAAAADLGGIVVDAMRDGGILAAGKHFPGSGDGDPHDGLPVFSYDLTDPDQHQILPFRRVVSGHGLAALMTSHVLTPSLYPPSLGPGPPATLSGRVQTGYLRDFLGFRGMVMTDDINMGALTGGMSEKDAALAARRDAVAALAAGADMIMYLAEDIEGLHGALVGAVRESSAWDGDGGFPGYRGLPEARLDDAVTRIIEQKIRLDLWNRSGELAEAAAAAGRTAPRPADTTPPRPAGGTEDALRRRLEDFARLKAEGDLLLRRFLGR
jgi:beta-N-acetylhexosaminidase